MYPVDGAHLSFKVLGQLIIYSSYKSIFSLDFALLAGDIYYWASIGILSQKRLLYIYEK